MARFKYTDNSQRQFISVNLSEQLIAGTFEWALGYSTGILSSRRMIKASKTNIVVKALAEDSEPDHDTIATFISTNRAAVINLFAQVAMQCDELELITGEMYALEGCKMPSNASKELSGTIAGLKKKKEKLGKHISQLILRHQELDKSEETKMINSIA